jgi:hypothetical protein
LIPSTDHGAAGAFVSYAHDDLDVVRADIAHLAHEGIPVWFDESIRTGADWREDIAEHITRATCVVAFVSSRSLASRHCRQEILFALDEDKPILTVMLEDIELSGGLRMALRDRQALLRAPEALEAYRGKLVAGLRHLLSLAGSDPATAKRGTLRLRVGDAVFLVPEGLTGEYTLGRDEACHLTLRSAFVSRVHAYVRRAGSGFMFGDRSKNGSRLIGADGAEWHVHEAEQPVPEAGVLEIGDQLVEFEFVADAAVATQEQP